jgi:hypothetical protein
MLRLNDIVSQYALRDRAVALGSPSERVPSSIRASDFREVLVAAVGLREIRIMLGLEVSLLARDSADWQQLLRLCAHPNTQILDEQGSPIHRPSTIVCRLA